MAFGFGLNDERVSPRLQSTYLRMRDACALSPDLQRRVHDFSGPIENYKAGETLQNEDGERRRPRFLISGWACRCLYLRDGRRQIVDFVLPGDGIGVTMLPDAPARTSTVAMTDVQMCDATDLVGAAALRECPEMEQVLRALIEVGDRRMLDHIVRLGRLSALERVAHLVVELDERLSVIGQTSSQGFPFPVTQETLSDLLGLSVVHVNRTIQGLRQLKLATLARRGAVIHDRVALQALATYSKH